MAESNLNTSSISAAEYQEFVKMREEAHQKMLAANSDFMYQTHRKIWTLLNKRYQTAIKLNIKFENKAINEQAKTKRESLAKQNPSKKASA